MTKKLDTTVNPIPGDFVWDKMTGKKYIVLHVYEDGSLNLYDGEKDKNGANRWAYSLKPTKRRWYLLWLA